MTITVPARVAFGGLGLAIGLLLLSGCAALPQPPVNPVTVEVPEDFPIERYRSASGGRVFRVDDASLTLKTYRAGWLKSLAHNHVMTTSEFTGLIFLSPEHDRSFADIYFRPYDLVLDEPAARAAAGPGFESVRDDDDIAATRSRMLGPKLLASNAHPFINVRVSPGPADDQLSLTISLRDEQIDKVVPVSWYMAEGKLNAESEFQLSHSELKLKPYSAFANALAVADQIDVTITVQASELARGALNSMR